ncbi:MAG: hypothetical protein JXR96_07325 [Deltaproteobacteria bacterium]|nr:hypothetical protein [Deltaproteobacteria bacterium]
MAFVLGVDAGGTKTVAVIADERGEVHAVGRAGSANFQDCGTAGAASQIRLAVQRAAQAGVDLDGLEAACYGVSGADRPKDFETVRAFVEPIARCPRLRLENDTLIALRAGTPDGVGLALVAGTGSNAIGRNAEGVTLQVGGLGSLSGDFGSASQLGKAAVVAAIQAEDGRGEPSSLGQRICERLDLERVEDIIELAFYDHRGPRLPLGALAPLVFEAAAEGDRAALGILTQAGREVARAARVILDKLFADADRVVVVFGGSVFQRGACAHLVETIQRELLAHRPETRFVILGDEPVLGAVQFALDDLLGKERAAGLFPVLRSSYLRLGAEGDGR